MRQLFIALTASLSLTTMTGLAQTDTTIKKDREHYWGSGGVQYFFSDNLHSLLGVHLGMNSSINQRHFIKFKAYAGITTSGTLLTISQPDRLATIGNMSFLYGFGKYITERFAIVPYAGISYGNAFWRGKRLGIQTQSGGSFGLDEIVYDDDKYTYTGIPIEISFIWSKPNIGASIDIYANIHKHPDFGLTFNWLAGKIRDEK